MRLLITILSFFVVINATLAQTCIMADYTLNGTALDRSSNAFHGQNNGAAPASNRYGLSDSALLFDGIDDHILLPKQFDYPARTISIWFNASVIDNSIDAIFTADGPNYQNGNTIMAVTNDPNTNAPSLKYTCGGIEHYMPIEKDIWYLATITRDASTTRFYLNCVNVFSGASQSIASKDGVDSAVIGCGRKINNFFNGSIDNAMIYDCVLSDSEICGLLTSTQNDIAVKNSHSLFPNPALDKITIQLADRHTKPADIIIYNLNGQIVKQLLHTSNSSTTISVADWASGMYFYTIIQDDEQYTGQFTVQ